MDWYAVQTQPNRENLALEHLKRQGFSVWMPLCERIIRHARKSKRVRRPLFPGYLFINLDVETAQWRSINGTIGVNRIVSFGQWPAPVAAQFIDALQNIEANEGLVAVNGDDLLPGQDVEILSGPMAGTIAKLLSLEAGDRVTVLLNMLGHFVRGKILREHVAKEIGPIAKPRTIFVVAELPKTRSGKIMRRLLRDVAEDRPIGDVTTLADTSVMDTISGRISQGAND